MVFLQTLQSINCKVLHKIIFTAKSLINTILQTIEIYAVNEIPKTRSGKIVEILIKKLINGDSIENEESLANPECLKEYELVYKNLKNNYAK